MLAGGKGFNGEYPRCFTAASLTTSFQYGVLNIAQERCSFATSTQAKKLNLIG